MRTITIFLSIIWVANLNAQIKDTTNLPSEEVEVVKYFKTTLQEAQMIPIDLPTIPEKKEPGSLGINYIKNPPLPLNVEIPDPEIRALAFTEDKEYFSNNGIMKLGYGNLKSPELEGHYHYFIEDWFEVGAKANFYSAEGKDIPGQKMRDSGLGIYAAYFLNPQTKVKASIDGSWDKRYFYDFIPDNREIDDHKRNINNYNFDASIHHTPFQNKKLILNSDFFIDNIGLIDSLMLNNVRSKETTIGITNHWGKRFGNNSEAGIYLDSKISSTNSVTLIDTSYSRIELEPFLMLSLGALTTKLGVHYDKTSNVSGPNDNVIWPLIDLKYSLKGTGINLILRTDVDSYVNNINSISSTNPFWTASFNETYYPITASKSFQAGISGNAFDLAYDFMASRINHKNHLFFKGTFDGISYLTSDMNETNLALDLNYKISLFDIDLGIEKRFFSIPDGNPLNDGPTYNPDLIFEICISENLLNNRLRLSQEFTHQSKREIIDFDIYGSLSSINDVNLLADFRVSNFLNIYFEAKNVLGSDYQIWQGFENFGFNMHGGLKLVF